MTFRFLAAARASVICCLIFAMGASLPLQAQSSIIQPSELRDVLKRAASTRQKNLDQVKSFFANEPVRNVLAKSGFESRKIEAAASSLSNEELAKVAARTAKIQSDFAGGSLTNEQLTYIVIALATAVIVLIIVEK